MGHGGKSNRSGGSKPTPSRSNAVAGNNTQSGGGAGQEGQKSASLLKPRTGTDQNSTNPGGKGSGSRNIQSQGSEDEDISSTAVGENGVNQKPTSQWSAPEMEILQGGFSPLRVDPLLLEYGPTSASINEDDEQMQEGNHHEENDEEVAETGEEEWDPDEPDTQSEASQNESEAETQHQDQRDKVEDICQRHPMWAQIVAENLERTRKNPARTQDIPEIEYDMEELLEAIDDIIETSPPAGDNGDLLVLDSKILVAKVRKLKKQSFIIHTVDMWVTIEYFERWAEEIITRKLGVPIEGITQVSNEERRDRQIQHHQMMRDGRPNQELRDVIKMIVPQAPDRIMKQALTYTKLPDACFICRERSHFARTCPTVQQQGEEQAFASRNRNAPNTAAHHAARGTAPAPAPERRAAAPRGRNPAAVDNEGFRRVRSRSRRRFREPEKQVNMKINNRFGVLQDEEAGSEEENNVPERPATNPLNVNTTTVSSATGSRSVTLCTVPRTNSQGEGITGAKHAISPDRRLSIIRSTTSGHGDGRKKQRSDATEGHLTGAQTQIMMQGKVPKMPRAGGSLIANVSS
ncbi:hypothetical protein R1sor_006463 [Riccia sorocarpa]|uniref:CCHC-type domain-containing protein n=1 Tax=Riccia sorocarpa TaxID=122646 RepID=A0ABD3HQH9_9MARC